jgi:quercetin dioxygenase-like cupin family protein
MKTPLVTPWAKSEPPTQSELMQLCAEEALRPYQWSNGPHDVYSAHKHSYDKVIFVVRGSIMFGLPEEGREILLEAGDRLDLPANTVHDAVVGSQGVLCLEAHQESQ